MVAPADQGKCCCCTGLAGPGQLLQCTASARALPAPRSYCRCSALLPAPPHLGCARPFSWAVTCWQHGGQTRPVLSAFGHKHMPSLPNTIHPRHGHHATGCPSCGAWQMAAPSRRQPECAPPATGPTPPSLTPVHVRGPYGSSSWIGTAPFSDQAYAQNGRAPITGVSVRRGAWTDSVMFKCVPAPH